MRCRLSLIVLLVWSAGAFAEDWPQWLGPTRDGASSEKIEPWKEAPKVLWHISVGEGHSSPVVANGKTFLHFRREKKDSNAKAFDEVLVAYEAKSGKRLWETVCGDTTKFSSLFGNGPRSTPSVVDDRIYTLGVTGILSCFEADKGKLLWQKDTLKEFNAPNLFFGVSGSPLVDGDFVLLNVGGKNASIVALDRKTGEVAWKKLDDPASYSSGIVFGKGKERQAVFLTGKGLVALHPQTGALFWQQPFVDNLNESSTTPVHLGNLLVSSTIMSGALALDLAGKDGKPSVKKVAWKNPDLTCYFSTPVAVGMDHLYMVTGSSNILKAQANLHCVEAATGKVLWTKPKVGKYHACLIRTGDDKLLMLEEGSDLVLVQPDPKLYRELARSKVCGETWAHPALSNGKLYVRDAKELICLQLEK
ncbi:MAG: PQQ-binding-like beta-propeller repeat protein [Gemmataceae bacterium]